MYFESEKEQDLISDLERCLTPLTTPPKLQKLTIFLDLDNTLIYKTNDESEPFDFKFTIGSEVLKIKMRPHLDDFLEDISKFADLYIFTSATKKYAENVFNFLNTPKPRIIKYFSREDLKKDGKDLSILKTSLERTILIDDIPSASGDRDNILHIREYKGEEGDNELLQIKRILEELKNVPNVPAKLTQVYEAPQLGDEDRPRGSRAYIYSA